MILFWGVWVVVPLMWGAWHFGWTAGYSAASRHHRHHLHMVSAAWRAHEQLKGRA